MSNVVIGMDPHKRAATIEITPFNGANKVPGSSGVFAMIIRARSYFPP